MTELLILGPALAGLFAFLIRPAAPRRLLLVGTASIHFLLCLSAWFYPPAPRWTGWLALDPLGLLFLSITSVIFLLASFYCLGSFLRDQGKGRASEAIYTGCLLLFLATMTLMSFSQHLGIYWIALEASTLVSAPLIYYRRDHRSLEATWKYLMICSVGIAIALLGNFFLAVAASNSTGDSIPLVLPELLRGARLLHPIWLRAAFLLFLVGYGTKMGLAPLHTWLPDAHSEAPSVVSALLSGALLNCAFLGILRAYQVCQAAGQGAFCEGLLRGFGLLSIAMAAVFILNQTDFKRMLAYSSVENMGILSLGVGLGGSATFGALLHSINHSFAKAMLFLLAGNILDIYHTKTSNRVRGVLRASFPTGALWLAGLFAVSGFPPFGSFLSEFTILLGGFQRGHAWETTVFLVFLAIIFVGMSAVMLPLAQGPAVKLDAAMGEQVIPRVPARWLAIAPPAVLCALLLLLGLYLPPPLQHLLHAAARSLGGS